MDRTERFYRIDQLLQERRAVPMETLIEDLSVSRATIKRDLEYLRDRLNAPILWDPERRGYRYEVRSEDAPRYALPGLWFNATEVHALLTMERLLTDLQPGLLSAYIEPLRTRIRMLLDSGDHSAEAIEDRVPFFTPRCVPCDRSCSRPTPRPPWAAPGSSSSTITAAPIRPWSGKSRPSASSTTVTPGTWMPGAT